MTLQVSEATVAEVDPLRQTSDPTGYTQIYETVLSDIRGQLGGAQFRIEIIPDAADRDTFRWMQFAQEMNSGLRNANTDLVRASQFGMPHAHLSGPSAVFWWRDWRMQPQAFSIYWKQLGCGVPGGIRTHGPEIRNLVLYPAELRGQPTLQYQSKPVLRYR